MRRGSGRNREGGAGSEEEVKSKPGGGAGRAEGVKSKTQGMSTAAEGSRTEPGGLRRTRGAGSVSGAPGAQDWRRGCGAGGQAPAALAEVSRNGTQSLRQPNLDIAWRYPMFCVWVGFIIYRFSIAPGGEMNRSPNFNAN